jgi:hypothetical protein
MSAGDSSAASTVPELFKNREPSGFLGTKSRPLVAKLDILLDLLFRRILHDQADVSSSEWTAEKVIRVLKKQDHDLGN